MKTYSEEEVAVMIYKSIIEFIGTEEPRTEGEAIKQDKKINKWIEKILKK